MDTERRRCSALPRVLRRVEMFSDVVVWEGDECHVVQVKQRWWLHDDGSYVTAVFRADDPLASETSSGDDIERFGYLCLRFESLRRLALAS
jgi:hypothetical protein